MCFQNAITPLHVASKWGRQNMVILLLDSGANINCATRVSTTPVWCSAFLIAARFTPKETKLGLDCPTMTCPVSLVMGRGAPFAVPDSQQTAAMLDGGKFLPKLRQDVGKGGHTGTELQKKKVELYSTLNELCDDAGKSWQGWPC